MIVERLELNNYRNYKKLEVDFSEKTNVFYGNNAQGKTNILEAVYMCSTTKSHRGSKDRDIIQFDKDESHIKLIVIKRDVPYRIDMHLKKNRPKGVAVNGIPITKASELFGIINVVFFSPEDLDIIKRGPAERRRFIDLELCQLDKIYVSDLVNYNKCLNHRNKLLKELDYHPELKDTLDIWDKQLADYGSGIIERREKFVGDLNQILKNIHGTLTNYKENLRIKYSACIDKENLYNNLIKNRSRDLKQKITTVGPHRDDIAFMNGSIDLRTYGSQGQQRTAALSLKLSEIELVKSMINDMPILLLDDVLSELDGNRQNYLLGSLDNVQTFITCTGLDELIENNFSINKIHKVENGDIKN